MKQTFEFDEEQVQMIVTALGALKNRNQQKVRWLERKRLPKLRSQLADCITIGDDLAADGIRKEWVRAMEEVDHRSDRCDQISDLMTDIRRQAGDIDDSLLDFGD